MGKHFGNLIRLYGVNFYTLSQNELKPFTGMFVPGVANTIRRIYESLIYIGPVFFCGIGIVAYANDAHDKAQRKNPLDYECDV